MRDRFVLNFAAVLSTLVFLSFALGACGKQPPVGSREFNQMLMDGEILTVTEEVPGTSLRVAIAYGAEKTDIDGVWEMMKDLDRYDEFFERLQKQKVIRKEGKNVYYAEVEIGAEFPLTDPLIIMRYEFNDETKTVDFKLVEVLDGDVGDIHGYARIDDELGNGYVKLTLYIFMDLNMPFFLVPVANDMAEWTMENWAEAAKERVRKPLFREYVERAESNKGKREEERKKLLENKLKELDLDL